MVYIVLVILKVEVGKLRVWVYIEWNVVLKKKKII